MVVMEEEAMVVTEVEEEAMVSLIAVLSEGNRISRRRAEIRSRVRWGP